METMVSLYKKKDFSDTGDLILMLGGACNMSCRHCAQMPVRCNNNKIDGKINDKVWKLIDNYIQYSLFNSKEEHSVAFYGGEALLYWDTIKKVIKFFVDKYDILNSDAFKSRKFKFRTQSNGLLLTQDKVDFLNQYGVEFGFSYDAPYPFAVRGYVSDEICKLVEKINFHIIQATCSNAYNYDLLLAYRCLKAKFPKAEHLRITANLSYSFAMPKDITFYDWNKISVAIKKLRIASQLGDKFALSWFKMYFINMNRKYDMPVGLRTQSCLLNNKELSITLNGRYSACQNGNFFFGTVEDSMDTIKEKILSFIKNRVSPECDTCMHQDICSVHCQLDLRNEDSSYVTCKTYWLYFFNIFKEQILELSRPLSVEDKQWYVEQEKVMNKQILDFLNEGKRYKEEHTMLPSHMCIVNEKI